MEPKTCPETSVTNYQSALCNSQENDGLVLLNMELNFETRSSYSILQRAVFKG